MTSSVLLPSARGTSDADQASPGPSVAGAERGRGAVDGHGIEFSLVASGAADRDRGRANGRGKYREGLEWQVTFGRNRNVGDVERWRRHLHHGFAPAGMSRIEDRLNLSRGKRTIEDLYFVDEAVEAHGRA